MIFDSKYETIFQLIKQLDNCPGKTISKRLNNLRTSLYICEANFKELDIALTKYTKEVDSPSLQKDGYQITLEVVRLVHNAGMSVSTLIEQERKIYKKHYQNNPLLLEHDNKIAEYFHNPLAYFIKDFRNYLTHYTNCTIYFSFSSEDHHLAKTTTIKTSDLLCYKQWKKESEHFIKEHDPYIDIQSLFSRYMHNVNYFYEWLFNKLNNIHKHDLQELESIEAQLKNELKNVNKKNNQIKA